MKKSIIVLLLVVFTTTAFSQEEIQEDRKGKFRRDNIFLGGGVGLSVGGWGSGFSIGANPEIGYSITNWLDAGVTANYNYFSYKAEYNFGVRQRSTTIGTGVFARIHPIRNIFIHAQPEYNWITTKLRDFNYNPAFDYKFTQEAPSLLLGIGYGQRVIGNGSFFTVIMFDVGNNTASPYISSDGSKLPILRTGFNFYLRPKRER